MKKLYFILIFMSVLLLACTPNNFQKNYQVVQSISNNSSIQTCNVPRIVVVPVDVNIEQTQNELQGYELIGKSTWTDKIAQSNNHAMEQGKRVGACLVLWQKKYVGTIHTKERIPTLNPTQPQLFTLDYLLAGSPAPLDNYEEVPVSYKYFRHTALFFAKKTP